MYKRSLSSFLVDSHLKAEPLVDLFRFEGKEEILLIDWIDIYQMIAFVSIDLIDLSSSHLANDYRRDILLGWLRCNRQKHEWKESQKE
jgi:hypothetical protein